MKDKKFWKKCLAKSETKLRLYEIAVDCCKNGQYIKAAALYRKKVKQLKETKVKFFKKKIAEIEANEQKINL